MLSTKEQKIEELLSAITEAREALISVTSWRPAIELCAPELGGCFSAMYRAEALVANLDNLLAANPKAKG